MPAVTAADLILPPPAEGSKEVALRVARARVVQLERYEALGLLTGLLAFLPNIGAPISGTLMVLVGFSVSTNTGLFCMVVYAVVQTVDGNIIVPMVAKRTADLAPALVLGMQLIMGTLFGILGLMLADPMVAMMKVALERQSLRNEEGG